MVNRNFSLEKPSIWYSQEKHPCVTRFHITLDIVNIGNKYSSLFPDSQIRFEVWFNVKRQKPSFVDYSSEDWKIISRRRFVEENHWYHDNYILISKQ